VSDNHRTVWVVNDSGHDYSSGAKYGKLKPLTKGPVNIFTTHELLSELKNTLADSRAEDILMYSGGPARIAVLASHIMMTKHGVVNELIFGHTKSEYTKREFTFGDVADGLNQTRKE